MRGYSGTFASHIDRLARPYNHSRMKFRVIIEADEDGVYVAECPTLPGCVSQGATRDEAIANIRDAIAGYLQSLEKHGDPVPSPISEEIVEVTP